MDSEWLFTTYSEYETRLLKRSYAMLCLFRRKQLNNGVFHCGNFCRVIILPLTDGVSKQHSHRHLLKLIVPLKTIRVEYRITIVTISLHCTPDPATLFNRSNSTVRTAPRIRSQSHTTLRSHISSTNQQSPVPS